MLTLVAIANKTKHKFQVNNYLSIFFKNLIKFNIINCINT